LSARAAAGLTIGALRRKIAERLRGSADNPALDARLLVAHALRRDPVTIPLVDDEPVAAGEEARATCYAGRRLTGEPVARIIGTKEFWGRDFLLSPETLVPRPDTETVVEAVLAFVEAGPGRQAPLAIVDLGTGTGAILLSLLDELPQARGLALDRSEGAVRTARTNAEKFGLGGRTGFVVGNWTTGLSGPFDVVVANPPYIESDAIAGLPVDVRRHDPHLALDGGKDGLEAYRLIISDLPRILAPGGAAFLEMGRGQGPELAKIAEKAGFSTKLRADLAGIDRVAVLTADRVNRRAQSGRETAKNALGNRPRNG
jgi:release factor glutamine methyltransferase